MSIDLNGFWQSWDVVSGNTAATNEYEFWKGMVMSNGQVLNNQFDFFTYHNTTRYEWFKALQGTYPEVWDEYTFYKNTNDPRIFDFKTFYQYAGEYLVGTPPTPTPTPTITPTNTPTPTPTPVGTVEFIAAASSQISYSYEGQDWYVGNNTTGDSLRSRSLVYNGSRWLAGCSGGSLIIYSDDSINWSGTNASSVFDVFVNSIIWDGSKWFAGGRSSNVFAESTDGINWSALTDASTYFSRIFQLVYDGTNIVAAGWDLSNTPQVASTNDGGNTWTDIVTPFGSGVATSLTYSSDLGLYVYTQQSGFDNVYISNDRVNWSAVTNTDVSSNSTYSCGWDGTKFVLGNQYNTNPLFYSYDGIDWSGSTNGGDYFYVVNDLHWDGNNWYAVGAGGDPGEPRMAYSTDGISWTGITNFPSFATNFSSILAKNSPELIPPIPQPSPTPTPIPPTPTPSPAPWSPASLTGAYIWLDASDGITVTGSTDVVSWTDKISSLTFTTDTTGKFAYTSSDAQFNNKPTLFFDKTPGLTACRLVNENIDYGGEDLFQWGVYLLPSPPTLIRESFMFNIAGGGGISYNTMFVTNGTGRIENVVLGGNPRNESAFDPTRNVARIFIGRRQSQSPFTNDLWDNRTTVQSVNQTGAFSAATLKGVVGNEFGGNSFAYQFSGKIAELGFAKGTVTDSEVTQLINYLVAKYNITLN